MEGFVSDSAKALWDTFTLTGNVGVYMLYNAVQTGKYENILDNSNSYDDGGMTL